MKPPRHSEGPSVTGTGGGTRYGAGVWHRKPYQSVKLGPELPEQSSGSEDLTKVIGK